MARTLSCDFHFDLPNFDKVSDNAKDFISKLLILNAEVNQINSFHVRNAFYSDRRGSQLINV